ncbi:hypothetical protein BDV3_002517 [Batrachochytrium dendrobatidis]
MSKQPFDPIDVFNEAKWSLLEGFAHVTRIYRETASMLTQEGSSSHSPSSRHRTEGQQKGQSHLTYSFEPSRIELAHWAHQLHTSRTEQASALPNDSFSLLDDFDLLTHSDVRSGECVSVSSEGLSRRGSMTPLGYSSGLRDVVWDETHEADTNIGTFEILSTDFAPPPKITVRNAPVSSQVWNEWFNSPSNGATFSSATPSLLKNTTQHRVSPLIVRDAIFRGGLDESVRCEAWKFLYGLFSWDFTLEQRESVLKAKRSQYDNLKHAWKDLLKRPDESLSAAEKITKNEFLENIIKIEKDVVRTDRQLSFYESIETSNVGDTGHSYENARFGSDYTASPTACNPTISGNLKKLTNLLITYTTVPENDGLGFVQGMADLASPFLVVMQGEEADAFWCFVSLMESKKNNFRVDGTGMRSNLDTMEKLIRVIDPGLHAHFKSIDALNLFCCFRWFLVFFKREFKFEDVLVLWEVAASNRFTYNDMHFFIAMAILDEHRDVIVRHLMTFDEVIKYVNDLSLQMRLHKILIRTAQLIQRFIGLAQSRGCLLDSDTEPIEDACNNEPRPLQVPIQIILDRLIRKS